MPVRRKDRRQQEQNQPSYDIFCCHDAAPSLKVIKKERNARAGQLSLRAMTFEGLNEALRRSGISLSEDQAEAFVRHFVDGLEPRLTTPRQSKLFVNTLSFALPILKGEVHPVDQMLIEGIRVFYPKLYVTIRDNPEYFLKSGRGSDRDDTFRRRASELIDSGIGRNRGNR
jgi:predicted KAP-like P-loop ATPase